ncbi:uncharacterized protein TNCV_361211 [Trichonephila clavipes]|nr:uncharacterized protein TNCV_361211 [Trichonephila clavipes]
MAQRKHLDDSLRSRIIGRLECGRTSQEVYEELGFVQSVISRLWQRFQDDGNVSRCYSTGPNYPYSTGPSWSLVTTPNEDRYIFGSYCQKKQTKNSPQTCIVRSLQLPLRQFQGRPFTDA